MSDVHAVEGAVNLQLLLAVGLPCWRVVLIQRN